MIGLSDMVGLEVRLYEDAGSNIGRDFLEMLVDHFKVSLDVVPVVYKSPRGEVTIGQLDYLKVEAPAVLVLHLKIDHSKAPPPNSRMEFALDISISEVPQVSRVLYRVRGR